MFELIVTMTITTVLLVVIYPSYQHHLLITHRHLAETRLYQLASDVEEYQMRNHTYENAENSFSIVSDPQYDYLLQDTSAFFYRIVAIPKSSQIKDSCGSLSLDANGVRDAAHSGCWL